MLAAMAAIERGRREEEARIGASILNIFSDMEYNRYRMFYCR